MQQVYNATAEAFDKIRAGGGPFFFWIKMERLSSHTSSDDQKLYRSEEELRVLEKFDPLKCWKDQLIEGGIMTAEEFAKLDNEIKERVRREYAEAEKAEDPSPNELLANVTAQERRFPNPERFREALWKAPLLGQGNPAAREISDWRYGKQNIARWFGGRSTTHSLRRGH